MTASENQIVVYQPNETVRLDVRLENETVWLTQSQMGELFGCTTRNVRMHLENIYSCGELASEATRKDFFLVRLEGARQVRRTVTCYNLDAIISVGYRVNSILGVKFRQWATSVLKEYLLRGYPETRRLLQRIFPRPIPRHRRQGTLSDRRIAERFGPQMLRIHEVGRGRNPPHQEIGVWSGEGEGDAMIDETINDGKAEAGGKDVVLAGRYHIIRQLR